MRLVHKILLLTLLAGTFGAGYAFVVPTTAHAQAGKNLQVLPKTMSKGQIKATMKGIAKALGVQCDFCHNTDDMADDSNEHKRIARQMMRMTAEINKTHFKGKMKVGCVTCHNGAKEPKPPR